MQFASEGECKNYQFTMIIKINIICFRKKIYKYLIYNAKLIDKYSTLDKDAKLFNL